jgi:hypothetical protein
VNPSLTLAQCAIVLISGVHPEKTFCLPPSASHWLILVEVAIACAAFPAAASLFRKAYYSHQHSTATFLASELDDFGASGVAPWAIWGRVLSWKTTKPTAGNLSDEEEGRRLEWLFHESHGIKEEDDRIRELILRHTGAWHCTRNAVPQIHPRELVDLETED